MPNSLLIKGIGEDKALFCKLSARLFYSTSALLRDSSLASATYTIRHSVELQKSFFHEEVIEKLFNPTVL